MMVTKKQYNNIGLLGIGVLVVYFIISIWIREFWYIRLGMGLTSIFIVYFMFGMRFSKIVILIMTAFLAYSIIFYHEIRAFLILS